MAFIALRRPFAVARRRGCVSGDHARHPERSISTAVGLSAEAGVITIGIEPTPCSEPATATLCARVAPTVMTSPTTRASARLAGPAPQRATEVRGVVIPPGSPDA